MIHIYAPTSEYSHEELYEFYVHIGDTIQQTHTKYFLVVMGDWKAKVGNDGYIISSNTIVRLCNESTNERGER